MYIQSDTCTCPQVYHVPLFYSTKLGKKLFLPYLLRYLPGEELKYDDQADDSIGRNDSDTEIPVHQKTTNNRNNRRNPHDVHIPDGLKGTKEIF